jgi:hypothetical protein
MSGESIQNIFEKEDEEFEGLINQYDISKIYDEEEEHKCDEPIDSKDKWEKIGFKIEGEWKGDGTRQTHLHDSSPHGYSLCAIEAYTLAHQDMEVLNNEEKSESTMSNLDDMWYMEDKENYIQDFEDKDWDDNEDFKEETNANVVDGLHVPHDEK